METMPPYTYKFVKNQTGNSTGSNKKIGYLSKDVKVINDLIDDLSKLKTNTQDNAEMTNPLEIQDHDKESIHSSNDSSSTHQDQKSSSEKPKLKEQVRIYEFSAKEDVT